MKIYRIILSFLIVAGLTSCSDSGTQMYKNITGRAGEVVVVISNQSWDGAPGKLIREEMAEPNMALPQDEPLFDLVNVPHTAFKDIFKSTRNIIQTSISSTVENEGIIYKDDVWAYPQATVQIKAKSPEKFVEILNENKGRILKYFLDAEKERLTMNYNKFYEKSVYNVLDQDFNVTMKVPPGFQIARQEKDFYWFKYDTPEIEQGIIIYSFPYVSDSAFTVDYQLSIRDKLLKNYVPGPTEGSYMATEKRFGIKQISNFVRHNGNYATEMRGLWRTVNDYMGGPYISLAELDAANQRVLVAYAYIYAPSKNKRNLLRQMEAMIYSLQLNDQAENNKVADEISVGE